MMIALIVFSVSHLYYFRCFLSSIERLELKVLKLNNPHEEIKEEDFSIALFFSCEDTYASIVSTSECLMCSEQKIWYKSWC